MKALKSLFPLLILLLSIGYVSCSKDDSEKEILSKEGKLLVGEWKTTSTAGLPTIKSLIFYEDGGFCIQYKGYGYSYETEEGEFTYDSESKELITTVQGYSFYVKLLTEEYLTVQRINNMNTYSFSKVE